MIERETLRQKQSRFVRLVGLLIEFAYNKGYELSFGDAYRDPTQARQNAFKGTGIANSLHCDRLAIDFNLFRDGQYMADGSEHKELGEYWESLAPDCVWGGRFGDGNHYSIKYAGRK